MNAFIYADDLILLSPSILELQNMVDICCKEFALIDLKLNVKSTCMGIGSRWHRKCVTIHTENSPICCVKEMKYLGVKIVVVQKFKIHLMTAKPILLKFQCHLRSNR